MNIVLIMVVTEINAQSVGVDRDLAEIRKKLTNGRLKYVVLLTYPVVTLRLHKHFFSSKFDAAHQIRATASL